MDNIQTKEELVENIENLKLNSNYMYEIVLTGYRKFEINSRDIFKLVNVENILKIKDSTEIGYDIEKIMQENNLRGLFVREVIKKYESGLYTEEQIKKTIEIGLSAL